ncbi:MAG TPA: hypothetical protein VF800_02935 [Telluria sp.]|jgi:hypothetical protein
MSILKMVTDDNGAVYFDGHARLATALEVRIEYAEGGVRAFLSHKQAQNLYDFLSVYLSDPATKLRIAGIKPEGGQPSKPRLFWEGGSYE